MKKVIFFLILLFSINAIAQKQANIWYFGDKAGLDFNRNNTLPLLDGQLQAFEGCATISDADGDLLFYTNGVVVYNRNHEIMLNGEGLNGSNTSTHSAMIIPKPLDANIYYIFTVAATFGDEGLQYSEVDMTLDGGLGGINANKNIPLVAPISEKVTATASTIPTEYWVITHKAHSDEFVSYNVTNTGVNTTPVISAAGSVITGIALNSLSQMKVSPDGTKLAMATPGDYREVQLFDFNATTGEVTNARTILNSYNDSSLPDGAAPYGVEFSPNSNLLYISLIGAGVYQFDVNAGATQDIINSRVTVNSTARSYGALQLGPDEKIYISILNGQNIDRIESPDTPGTGSDYRENEVSLGGRTAQVGLPSFIQSFLQPANILFEKQCYGDATTFRIDDNVTSILWDFGDPASGVDNTSTEDAPSHVFSAPGTYTVTVTAFQGSVSINFSIDVIIFDQPIIDLQPSDLINCDADGNGSEIFDLTVQTPVILGTQNASLFEVIYAADNTFSSPISDPSNYTNTSTDQTIHFRVFNRNNPSCFVNGSFVISIGNNIILPTEIIDYEQCDDDTDGFVNTFLLSTKDSEILQFIDPTLYEVNYFESLDDAENNINSIDKTVPYQNIIVNSQTIYVRVNEIVSALCLDTSLQFNLIVNQLPTVNPLVELRQCDDDIDGFSLFNLNEAIQEVSNNFNNEIFIFYPTFIDAENDTNRIVNPTTYQNQTVTTDTVWVKTIRQPNCYRISEVTLIVSTTGIPPSFQKSFTTCDDFLDIDGNDTVNNDDTDGVSTFDFSSVTEDVSNLFPPTQQLIITYYRNESDALAELNPITDTSNYRNIGYPITQEIYVRVDSQLDNDCLGLAPAITLTTDPVPEANPVNNLELCDDDADGDGFNGFVQSFNLDSQTATILGTQNSADHTVTYHTTAADALSGTNAISNTNMYENTTVNQQTIFVRVTYNTTGCFTNHTSFDLIVNPLPIANFVEDLEVCDDDSDGSAQNGFSQNINLELQTASILGAQDPSQFSVTYHASLSNAQAGILPLGSPFSNTVPDQQIIYVRVSNADTQCANGISNFNVIVNPEPTTENVSNLSYCDDDLDGDDTNGFVQNIDLDSQIPGILGSLQDEDDFTVTFHETQADAIAGTGALSSPYTNTTQDRQTIYVRVVNDDTGCVNDNDTFDIVVNPLPDFTVTTPQIVCLNGPELVLSVENPAAVYDYQWTTADGNTIIGSQITITSGGLYTVTGTTTDGTNCSRTREIQVNESIIATISDADITIVDDSDNNSITIDPTNLGIGDYEYALLDDQNNFEVNYQDTPVFENLMGGFYTILVRDKNGCGIASLLVSVIEFPKFFTPNNDEQNDTWAIKGANSTFFPTSQISIFNRFGKLVAQIDIDNVGWTGTYNGKTLPSDDYWYAIKLIDRNGVVRERKGNMSLLRRER